MKTETVSSSKHWALNPQDRSHHSHSCKNLKSNIILPVYCAARDSVVVRSYAASRKVEGSRPNEVNDFFLSIPTALGPGVYSVSNRNEYQKQKNVSGE
jgi:hypothetical protein